MEPISALIALLSNPIVRLIIMLAIALCVGFVGGWRVNGAFCEADKAQTQIEQAAAVASKATAALRIARKQDAATASVETAHGAAQSKIKTVYTAIEKEVIRYVPASDNDCWSRALPGRFVGLWNSASAGSMPAVPNPAAKPDGSGGPAGAAPR